MGFALCVMLRVSFAWTRLGLHTQGHGQANFVRTLRTVRVIFLGAGVFLATPKRCVTLALNRRD